MSALRGGRSRNAGSVELERQVEGSEGAGSVLSYNPNINLTLAQQRQRLPVFKVSPRTARFLLALQRVNVATVRGQTFVLCPYSTAVRFSTCWRNIGLLLSLERLAQEKLLRCPHAFFVTIYVYISIILFQIPQYLHEANWTGNGYVVGITQPRRVAATTVSIQYRCDNKIFGVEYL